MNNLATVAIVRRIVVETIDDRPVRKTFKGQMLVECFYSRDFHFIDRCNGAYYAEPFPYYAAQGEHGGIALWVGDRDFANRDLAIYPAASDFRTYKSLEDAKADALPEDEDDWSGIWPKDFLEEVSAALEERQAEEIEL